MKTWVYLAKHIINVSDFCLTAGTYIELSLPVWWGIFQFIDKPISYSDIYNWSPISTQKDMSMFSLQVRAVTLADQCVNFTGCSDQCFILSGGNSLNCSFTTSMSYSNAHVKLLAGWFLICGKIAYSYVAAYSTG